ncbi:hypothetical protein CVIRNUC_001170 [Coccomyxa viridis]|uniref:Uncharacterized protein n=1 Tax=Coccomyxa viridis TaxID=1274662 RepID=A0AAV1HWR2_9CHLO|nr:hypothetical protein CVIRNUC_001170 [Coccomyxa viridis]
MGRRSNYDNRGFQQSQAGNNQQGGVFGRLQQQPGQSHQEDAQQGSWGQGYRGNQRQQGRGQDRFGAFNQDQDDRWNATEPSQGTGGQRTNPRQQAADWRAIMREDLKTEKPPWPFTCYAHQRSEANDVVGDFQYEEVRWYQMEAAKSGKSVASLMADFNASHKAEEQRFQMLLRMNQPPSLSRTPPEEPPNPFVAQQNPFQPSTPFGQTVGAFGRNPAAMPPMPAFGNGFAPSPAQSMPTAGPSSGSSTGFGRQHQDTLGQQGPTVFGQRTAPQQSSRPVFGSGHQRLNTFQTGQTPFDRPNNTRSAFGNSTSGAAGASFGSQQQQQSGIFNNTGSVSAGPSAAAGGLFQKDEQARETSHGGSDDPWLAQQFQRGYIPEQPPPPEVC